MFRLCATGSASALAEPVAQSETRKTSFLHLDHVWIAVAAHRKRHATAETQRAGDGGGGVRNARREVPVGGSNVAMVAGYFGSWPPAGTNFRETELMQYRCPVGRLGRVVEDVAQVRAAACAV